jgi:hypothetical protein
MHSDDRGVDLSELVKVIEMLADGQTLLAKYSDLF